ncbi:hypothetical protein FBU59_007019 [Linderina macrospora]|uniref:Uncharacterized protein n=1 Tax=Linderina macrospora TaxID=4868 RepID=A0ACC1IYH3_9FUNG|nr:hypothetical protein FBU59_007019 [Linderina macrospora]
MSQPAPSETKQCKAPEPNPKNPQGLKPCCVCLETKKARDSCYFDHGDDAEKKCHYLVLAHKMCMESFGFKI